MTTQKGWIEKMLLKIPGYRGYANREDRRTTDQLLREQITASLEKKKPFLDNLIRDYTSQGKLDVIGEIDRVKRKLGNVSDLIRFATHGASGFFDLVKVKEAELDKLYQFDMGIKDQLDQFLGELEMLPGLSDPAAACQALCLRMDDLAAKIKTRDQVILEVN